MATPRSPPARRPPYMSAGSSHFASASTSSLIEGSPYLQMRGSYHRVQTPSAYSDDGGLFSGGSSRYSGFSEKFALMSEPKDFDMLLSPGHAEPDDYLHDIRGPNDRSIYSRGHIFTWRGIGNIGCLLIIVLGLLGLFVAGPVISFLLKPKPSNLGAFNIGGTNRTGQVPKMEGNIGLIDLDTPEEAHTKPSYNGKGDMQLVFSDEFNVDGRSFYPGDDPYWEAVDIHYAATGNLEWYDPEAITTRDGALEITLDRKQTHDLNFQGGMLQSWNKFCFTGGIIEAAVTIPGQPNVQGLWPAIWTMGNLGRAGFGATTEGLWPYSYDACDVGTAPNQTHNSGPDAAVENGDKGALSWLPGQRLSACTCPGESHPGPVRSDGSFVGRSAPEIDLFEAQNDGTTGQVSQSAQWAPFNANYKFLNTTDSANINDMSISFANPYTGGRLQQATSVVSQTNPACYDQGAQSTSCYSVYGYEYKPGFDDAYITWINGGKASWTINAAGVGADNTVQISARPIPQEPMYAIINLGISDGFGNVDMEHLIFPTKMRVDYIRIYQPKDNINIGCSPKDFPTADYIEKYQEAYLNFNYTTWKDDFKQTIPKSKFLGEC